MLSISQEASLIRAGRRRKTRARSSDSWSHMFANGLQRRTGHDWQSWLCDFDVYLGIARYASNHWETGFSVGSTSNHLIQSDTDAFLEGAQIGAQSGAPLAPSGISDHYRCRARIPYQNLVVVKGIAREFAPSPEPDYRHEEQHVNGAKHERQSLFDAPVFW